MKMYNQPNDIDKKKKKKGGLEERKKERKKSKKEKGKSTNKLFFSQLGPGYFERY